MLKELLNGEIKKAKEFLSVNNRRIYYARFS